MIRQIIIVDIDGVLAEFTYAFSSLAMRWGLVERAWTCGEQPTWEWSVLGEADTGELWTYIKDHPLFWADLDLIITSPEVQAFHDFVNEFSPVLLYMTERAYSSKSVTEEWLRYQDLPYGELIMMGDKLEGIRKHVERKPDRELLSIIDDKPKTLEILRDRNLPVTARDWAYNRDIEGIHRVSSFGEWLFSLRERLSDG